MSRFHPSSFALLSLVAVACGGSAKPPVSATTPSVAPAASASVAAAPSAVRVPPAELARYVPFAKPGFTFYADLGGFFRTELGSGVVPAVVAIAGGGLSDLQKRCLQGVTENVKDVLVVANPDDTGVLVARYDDRAFDLGPCLLGSDGHEIQLEGAKRAFTVADGTIALLPGLAVAGEQNVVKAALGAHPAVALPPEVKLGADEYLAWSGQVGPSQSARGTLLASSKRFRLGLEVDASEGDAQEAEQQFKAIKQNGTIPGLDPQTTELAAKLLQSFTLTRSGGHLAGAFDLLEPPQDQARDLGMMAALATYGVRKYLIASKAAEARAAIAAIAKNYTGYLSENASKPGVKLKLVSFPAVPKKVPSGVRYQSAPSEWKPWEPLRFAFNGPQYYQYEVRAAKDGKSADIIARGDLNGDGKDSEFRLHLALDKDRLTIGPDLEEHDPEE